jgi:hypothetical protein
VHSLDFLRELTRRPDGTITEPVSKHDYAHRRNDSECDGARMSAHRLIRYLFRGISIVPFDAYGRSLLRAIAGTY